MTVCAIIFGLLPIMWSSVYQAGVDVMTRIATPMIGGVITTAVLNLLIYPVIYVIWRKRSLLPPAPRGLPAGPSIPESRAMVSGSRHRVLAGSTAVLLIGALIGGAYLFWSSPTPTPSPSPFPTPTPTPIPAPPPVAILKSITGTPRSGPPVTHILVPSFDDEFYKNTALSLYDFYQGTRGNYETWFYWGTESSAGARQMGGQNCIFSDAHFNGVNPFSISAGNGLTISAAPLTGGPQVYSSGVITTQPSFSQTYGYFEAQLKLPVGAGLWPAFWMLSQADQANEELDVMENIGVSTTAYSSVRYHVGSGSGITQTVPVSDTSQWHTYGMLWDASNIYFYVDEVQVATQPNPGIHDQMYMIVNLQTGASGSWPGRYSGSGASMNVGYLRAYSLK